MPARDTARVAGCLAVPAALSLAGAPGAAEVRRKELVQELELPTILDVLIVALHDGLVRFSGQDRNLPTVTYPEPRPPRTPIRATRSLSLRRFAGERGSFPEPGRVREGCSGVERLWQSDPNTRARRAAPPLSARSACSVPRTGRAQCPTRAGPVVLHPRGPLAAPPWGVTPAAAPGQGAPITPLA